MAEPLKVLMITHHRRCRTGGRSLVMARHLVQRGHRVTLMATADRNRWRFAAWQEDGLTVIEAPDLLWGKLRSGWDPWALLRRWLYLAGDTGRYDLVHCFETRPTTIYPAQAYIRRRRLPWVTDWNDWFGRGGLIEVLRPAWYRRLFGGVETYYEEAFRTGADGVTVISTALAQRAQGLGVPAEQICYIPGGANPTLYPCRPRQECRARMGYAVEGPILGFASADSHLDVAIILRALALVAQRYPDVRLILTGLVRPEVLAAAQVCGVAERLILPGFLPVEQLSWCLGCADVFLLPFPETIYNVGRWPNKLGLYLALGRPVVANAVGDIRPLFVEQNIGLAAAYTAPDFAAKIIALLENPPLAAQMGATAQQLAATRYNWKTLIVELEMFYQRILQRKEAVR